MHLSECLRRSLSTATIGLGWFEIEYSRADHMLEIDFGTSGNFNSESKVWSDNNEDDIKAIHKGMFNGQSDTLVLEAGANNTIETFIVCPAVVYGGASVSAPTMGVGYSLITGNAKPLGWVPYVGEGTAVLSTVRWHILWMSLITLS